LAAAEEDIPETHHHNFIDLTQFMLLIITLRVPADNMHNKQCLFRE
jgi:hypothetical protein